MHLLILMYIHVLIWIFVIIGGIVNYKICLLSLLVFLPLIYIVQMFPIHILVGLKINYIRLNFEELSKDIDFEKEKNNISFDERNAEFPKIAKFFNIDEEELVKYFCVYMCNEDPITSLFRKCKLFFDFSFKHPLSAQGLIILGFIFNFFLLVFVHKKIIW